MTTDDPTPGDSELEAILAGCRRFAIAPRKIEDVVCRECAGPVVLTDAMRYGEADVPSRCAACVEKRERADRERSAAASIPPAYEWASLASPQLAGRVAGPIPSGAALVGLMRATRVVFLGPAGSGKTSLAVALLREATARSDWGRFVHAFRLATARGRHKLGDGEAPLVTSALKAGLLLIDDVGNERRTELSALPDVIFERHAEEAATWITTAFDQEAMAGVYGDGVARRMFERAVVLRLGTKS